VASLERGKKPIIGNDVKSVCLKRKKRKKKFIYLSIYLKNHDHGVDVRMIMEIWLRH